MNWLIETTLLISLLNLVSKPSKWVPSQFYDGVHLKILPTLSEVILTHLFKACHEDEYDKINELSNFKCNLFPCFNKLRDTADDLGWKKAFFRTWNSILNNNGNLNIQFNQLFFLSTMPHSNFKRFQIIYLVNAGKPFGFTCSLNCFVL